jgi:hypothetical protein
VKSAGTRTLTFLVLVASACAPPPRPKAPSAAGPTDDLFRLIPANADLVVDADLAGLRAVPALAKLMTLVPAARRQALAHTAGFDWLLDIDRVLVAAQMGRGTRETVVFATGRFDPLRVRAAAEARGAVAPQPYRGTTLFETAGIAQGLLTDQLYGFGGLVHLRTALDLRAARIGVSAVDPELDGLLRGAGDPARILVRVIAKHPPATHPLLGESTRTIALFIEREGADLELTYLAQHERADQARDRADALRAAVQEIRPQLSLFSRAAAGILESLMVSVEGDRLSARLHATDDQLAELAALAEAFAPALLERLDTL